MRCVRVRRLVLVLVVLGVGLLAFRPYASAERKDRGKEKLPPGLVKKLEKWGFEGGRPPGWGRGEKTGWHTNLPPGLAKKVGTQEWEIFHWRLSNAEEEIREKARRKGLLGKVIDDVLGSLNLAARGGAPVGETAEVVGYMLDYGEDADSIDRATKALATGASKEVGLSGMGVYVQRLLEDGLTGDDLSVAIYREMDRRHREP